MPACSAPRSTPRVLYQDDDFGKELLSGLKEGLGAKLQRFNGKVWEFI